MKNLILYTDNSNSFSKQAIRLLDKHKIPYGIVDNKHIIKAKRMETGLQTLPIIEYDGKHYSSQGSLGLIRLLIRRL